MTKEEFITSISLDGEAWGIYPGGDGYYIASSMGRIISTKGRSPHLLKQVKCFSRGKPYYCVCLKQHKIRVHKIIASTFLGEQPFPNWEIDHINGDSLDNRVENLKWCPHVENMRNPTARERLRRAVVQIKDGCIVKTYKGAIDTAADGFIPSDVGQVCRGLSKTHRGCQWMYLDEYERRSD